MSLAGMIARARNSSIRELNCTRVLVVEDDPDLAELLGLILEDVGYQVCVAHSVASALQTAPRLQAHVALIDLGLPDGCGYELVALLLAEPRLTHCRYIATTGHGDREAIARSLELGFDEHLTKPLQPHLVLAAVARHAAAATEWRTLRASATSG